MKARGELTGLYRVILYSFLLVFLMPESFRNIWGGFYVISIAARGVGGLVSVFLLAVMPKRNKAVLILCVYILYAGLLTAANSFITGNIVRYVAIYADIFAVSVLTEYLITKDTVRFLKFMNVILWAGLLVNSASVFLFPDGMVRAVNEMGSSYAQYFYDYDNHFILKYIPSLAVFYLNERYITARKNTLKTYAAMLLCLVTLLYTRSIASFGAMAFSAAGCLVMDFIPSGLASVKSIWSIYLLTDAALISGNILLANSSLLTQLGKSHSFLVRARMWSEAVKHISRSPFIGTGALSTVTMRFYFGYAQLHNMLLTSLLWSGVLGLVIYSAFIASIEITARGRDKKFFGMLFSAAMIASLMDGIDLHAEIYMFYIIMANHKNIILALSNHHLRRRRLSHEEVV